MRQDAAQVSLTDSFIKHPVLAIVVNLAILLVGRRALTTLSVQQYPKIENWLVVITTLYYGAAAETVRGSTAPRSLNRFPQRTAVRILGGIKPGITKEEGLRDCRAIPTKRNIGCNRT